MRPEDFEDILVDIDTTNKDVIAALVSLGVPISGLDKKLRKAKEKIEMRSMIKHKTREGVEMFISEMTDDHLISAVRFFIAPLLQATMSICAQGEVNMDPRKKALYDIRKVSEREYREIYEDSMQNIAPFVIELTVRGKSGLVRDLLTNAIGRNAQEDVSIVPFVMPDDTFKLTARTDDEDGD